MNCPKCNMTMENSLHFYYCMHCDLEIPYKQSFAIELSQEDVAFIKEAYNLDSNGKVRNWMQMAFDLLLEQIKSIEMDMENAHKN